MVPILLLSMAPGLPEVIEYVEHMIFDGHPPHSEVHEAHASVEKHDHDEDTPEHGCNPLKHNCSCHAPSPAIASAATLLAPDGEGSLHYSQSTPPPSRTIPPPYQPPIS